MWDMFKRSGRGPGNTAVELSLLRRTWSAEFIPLPADLPVPRGGGLKSALLNSTAVGLGKGCLESLWMGSWREVRETKHQIQNTKPHRNPGIETPKTKLQTPKKSQVPSY